MFSDHIRIKLEITNKKDIPQISIYLEIKLHTVKLLMAQIWEFGIDFELNYIESTTYQYVWDVAKVVL